MFGQKAEGSIVRKLLARIALAAWLILLLIPAAQGKATAPAVRTEPPPGVHIEVRVTPKLATVGDPIRLELDISMPAGYRANIPAIRGQVGDFSVFEFSPGPLVSEAGNSQIQANSVQEKSGASIRHRTRIIAAAYRTGALTFPPIKIYLQAPDGKQFATASPPATIEIQSVLSEKDRNLKDLKKQLHLPEPVQWGFWLAVLLALLVLGAAAWLVWRRRDRHANPIPAAPPQNRLDAAEAELRALLARGLPEAGLVKPFYVQLSDLVKEILEAGYSIHTAEQTTSEIMDDLDRTAGRNPEDMERIALFLRHCDVVKFAKYIPSMEENESAARDALEILEISRKQVASRQPSVASQT